MSEYMSESDMEKVAILIASIVAFFVWILISAIVNERFRKKHDGFNLLGPSVAMFFAIGILVVSIGLILSDNLFCILTIFIFIAITGLVLYYNIKKLGRDLGIKALIIEILISVGSIVDLSGIIRRISARRARRQQDYENYLYGSDKQNFDQYINNSLNRRYQDEDIYRNDDNSEQ